MQDFLTFSTDLFQIVCEFLLTEPIVWFVGVLLLASVAQLVRNICTFK